MDTIFKLYAFQPCQKTEKFIPVKDWLDLYSIYQNYLKVDEFNIYVSRLNYHSIRTCKFLAERLSSINVRCPLTLDVAATRARLPWIKAEAWPLSISNWDCRFLSSLCSSKASALFAKVASLKIKKQKMNFTKFEKINPSELEADYQNSIATNQNKHIFK